jgi:hypothetical protein
MIVQSVCQTEVANEFDADSSASIFREGERNDANLALWFHCCKTYHSGKIAVQVIGQIIMNINSISQRWTQCREEFNNLRVQITKIMDVQVLVNNYNYKFSFYLAWKRKMANQIRQCYRLQPIFLEL